MSSGKRVLILVIDGLGIGAMPDVGESRQNDAGANTLLHVLHGSPRRLSLPNLSRLGLGRVCDVPGLDQGEVEGAYGRARLAYSGADTYLGHQELMGTIPGTPRQQLMCTVSRSIRSALEARHHRVVEFCPPSPMLLVDDLVVVADNMETDPGRNINVTAAYDRIPQEQIVEIGEIVRSVVEVSRVIVVMGLNYDADEMARHLRKGPLDTIGIDSPGLGVYTENYRVRHLGIGVDTARQLPTIARRAGLPVHLLGKAADVVECDGVSLSRDVVTADVLRKIVDTLRHIDQGVIVANVQEGDLSGHAEDPSRWADVLQTVDDALPCILRQLRPEDLAFVVADHGNDPSIGHSQHTRELTPLLIAGTRVRAVPLGTRASLSDTAATAAEHLEIDRPQDGASFLDLLFLGNQISQPTSRTLGQR
jgi:phosphopentomutase